MHEPNLEELFDLAAGVGDCFQVEPFLRFGNILSCILFCLVDVPVRVEWDDINCRRAEHRELEVVRYYPAIIGRVAATQGHTVCVLIVLLLPLLRPREEKPARAPVEQAISRTTRMDVQP